MSVDRTDQALPGFELEVATRAEQDVADIGADIHDKVFTGEMLRLRYPGKYALAARAFFEKNRSAESICDILRISPQTMHALVETECAARGFSSVKARIRAKSASVALRTVSELQKLLDNPEAVRKAGIVGLTNALKALTGNEDCNQEGEKPQKPSSEDNSAADEFIDVYESADGFWREKNPARDRGESTVSDPAGQVDDPAGPSASMVPEEGIETHGHTLVESARNAEIKDVITRVANFADKSTAESREYASAPCVAARASPARPPHPGGGAPALVRAGV